LFAERVIAVVRVTRQYKYRNRIGFVEPQQNCAFKLAYCRSLLVRYKKRRAKRRFGLFARLTSHDIFSDEILFVEEFPPLLRDPPQDITHVAELVQDFVSSKA